MSILRLISFNLPIQINEINEREREIERDFLFFKSASGRFEPTTPV